MKIKRQCSYQIDVGMDALGNLQRITNVLCGIGGKLISLEQKLENILQQFATAKEEVKKPFTKEAELSEKMKRLSELNTLLDMDKKDHTVYLVEEAIDCSDEENKMVSDHPTKSVLSKLKDKTDQRQEEGNRKKKFTEYIIKKERKELVYEI